jgi:hypothetical protein
VAQIPLKDSTDELIFVEKTSTREASDLPLPEIGSWYWVSGDGEKQPWLGCVIHHGSNHAYPVHTLH